MGLSITAKNALQLATGIWAIEMPPHQIRFFGDCRRTEGSRSVLLLSNAKYDAANRSLFFDADSAVPLNVGTTSDALAISTESAESNKTSTAPKSAAVVLNSYGPGDKEFLATAEELPPTGYEAAKELLRIIRSRSPGDLKRGLQRNFSNTPDNFWYAIVQPRSGGLSVTVRGEPARFNNSTLSLKRDRPGYTRFKVTKIGDVPEAINIIFASKRRD